MKQIHEFIVVFLAANILTASANSTVILVLFDGFRWDYMSKTDTPNMDFIAKTGVRAPFVKNVFPTVSMPNLYTIVTGLFPESHGLVANEMFDPQFKTVFLRANNESRWWNGGEPVWVTNQKHGFKSATCFWPGFDVKIRGYFPTYSSNGTGYSKPFISHVYGGKVMPAKDRIDMVMKWLTADEPPTFVAIYFEELDSIGHLYGPESPQVRAVISKQDRNVTGYLLRRLKEANLLDQVNLIITADHGMAAYNTSNFVNFDAIVDPTTFDAWSGSRAFFTIQPHAGNESYVYHALREAQQKQRLFTVYKKEEVPEDLHFKRNRRIGSIIGMMKEGWYLRSSKLPVPPAPNGTIRGAHGYSNALKTMYPFFIARGPAFKESFISEPFELTDIYPLICHILGIQPAPNNGSLSRVAQLLREQQAKKKRDAGTNTLRIAVIASLGFLGFICIVSTVLLIVNHWKRRKRQNALLVKEETQGLISTSDNTDIM